MRLSVTTIAATSLSLMFDHQPSDELPPPSYELSQETFERKTQQGIQASLEHQDNLWEEWDEAKFEANARELAQDSASSSTSAPIPPPPTAQQYPKEKTPMPPSPPPPPQEEPAVRPLRIVKKKNQAAAYKKAVEADSSNNPPSGPPSSTDGGASLSRDFSVLSIGRRTPPPMFETVGPNLDGPAYDEVVMSYVPGNSRPSSPVSILSNDSYRPPVPQPPPQFTTSRPNTTIPPPPPPPFQRQPLQRPISTQVQRPQYPPPRRRVGFDPMSAYKSKPAFTPGLEPTPERVDPSSFYK